MSIAFADALSCPDCGSIKTRVSVFRRNEGIIRLCGLSFFRCKICGSRFMGFSGWGAAIALRKAFYGLVAAASFVGFLWFMVWVLVGFGIAS
jgi:hypothetical protein